MSYFIDINGFKFQFNKSNISKIPIYVEDINKGIKEFVINYDNDDFFDIYYYLVSGIITPNNITKEQVKICNDIELYDFIEKSYEISSREYLMNNIFTKKEAIIYDLKKYGRKLIFDDINDFNTYYLDMKKYDMNKKGKYGIVHFLSYDEYDNHIYDYLEYIDVNFQDYYGWTILMYLIKNAKNNLHYTCIKSILEKNDIDIDLKTNLGTSIFMLLCKYSNNSTSIIILKFILDNFDIDINYQRNDKSSALMIVCKNCNIESSIETLKLLLDIEGIDVNLKNNEGWTALMIASRYSSTTSNNEAVNLLCNHNDIKINEKNCLGYSALMMASRFSNLESNIDTVKILLQHKDIDVNITDYKDYSILMNICKNINSTSSIDTLKLLLAHKNIDINYQNKKGWNILLFTIRYADNEEVIRLLLNHKDIKIYHNAISLSLKYSSNNITEMIKKKLKKNIY